MLIVTITGILLLIAGLVTTLLAVTRHRATVPRDDTTPDPVEGARGLTVEAGDMFFAPDRIEITAEEQLNLTLDNAGQVFHDLAIEDLDVRLAADPGTTTTGSLQVDQPGEYGFICTVPSHAAAGMHGTLNVQDR